MRIPQAIFTSLRGQKLEGYQLAAVSDGIGDELARELNVWGPAHDSLLDETADVPSVNFHSLGEELFCLSLTSSAGAEYSGRAGARIYTQMFVLSREALQRFDNNPWLILRTTLAAGRAGIFDDLPPRLRSLPLIGRAGEAHLGSLEQLSKELDPKLLSSLAAAVLEAQSVALATPLEPRLVVSALFEILSPEDRLKVSFTTGLRHSPRRPFRLFLLPHDPAALRHFHRQPGVSVVNLEPAAV